MTWYFLVKKADYVSPVESNLFYQRLIKYGDERGRGKAFLYYIKIYLYNYIIEYYDNSKDEVTA